MTKDEAIDHLRVADGYWFVPKLFGIGATPVTWQGWALTIGGMAALMLDMRFMPGTIARGGVGIAILMLFTVVAIRKTQGEWRWRWGPGKD